MKLKDIPTIKKRFEKMWFYKDHPNMRENFDFKTEVWSFIEQALTAQREEGKKEVNRNKWFCPHCKVGRNSKGYGGNDKCFHCGSCCYVECAIDYEKDIEQAHKEGKKESTAIYSFPNADYKQGYQKGYRTAKAKPMWTGLEKMAYQKGYRAGLNKLIKSGYKFVKNVGQTGLSTHQVVEKAIDMSKKKGKWGQTGLEIEYCYCGKPVDTGDPDCKEFGLCSEHADDV